MSVHLLAQQHVVTIGAGVENPIPISTPLIANPAAALEAITDFFEAHSILSKNEFVQLIRKDEVQAK